jgi:hypothetical protein
VSNAVAALRAVLVADAELIALVPASRIIAGVLPKKIALPAISITSISRIDDQPLAREDVRAIWERGQLMIAAKTYPEQKAVEKAARRALDYQLDPSVPGISDVTIIAEGAGPDIFSDDTSIYLGTQDYGVSYNEER